MISSDKTYRAEIDSVGTKAAQRIPGSYPVDTSIILPAFNEAEALPSVLANLLANLDETYEIIVVNDGSTDRTLPIAEQFGVRVFSHKQNKGKGAAMKTGIEHARGQKIIFMDADATYPEAMIPVISKRLDNFDFVRGVRVEGRTNIPLINRLGNMFFEMAVRFVHQVDSNDVLSGLYGLQAEALRKMRLVSNGFDIESEIVIKSGSLRLRTSYVPITYEERIGTKKLNAFTDGLKIFRRVLGLAVLYRPFITYVIPGLVLWLLAILAMFAFARGPLITSWAGFSTNTFIVTIMAFLAGFQLITFGTVANLYAFESGLGMPSRSLFFIAKSIPRTTGAILASLMVAAGVLLTVIRIGRWAIGGFGPFTQTQSLLTSLALVVWGMQILSTIFVLSLFVGVAQDRPEQTEELFGHEE